MNLNNRDRWKRWTIISIGGLLAWGIINLSGVDTAPAIAEAVAIPTAVPTPEGDEVQPDDSDLQLNDEIGPDNPTWEDYEQDANSKNEEDNTDTETVTPEPVSVAKLGSYHEIANAVYIVTKSDAIYGTVQYKTPVEEAPSVKVPSDVAIDGVVFEVTSIADDAFKNNTVLKNVHTGDSVTKIGADAFNGCSSLNKVTFGKSLKSIGKKAFYNCKRLTKLALPASVNKIGNSAFSGCKKLKNMTFNTKKLTLKKVGSKAFQGVPDNAVIKVPKAKVKSYLKIFRKRGLSLKVTVKKL